MATKPSRTRRRSTARAIKTLGPIADLESHLPDEWWNEIFNALYLKTDGDVVENDENTRREVDFIISSTAVGTHSDILDICCGQGRHALELAARGFSHVTGVDRSRYLIRLAKKRAAAQSLDVVFKEGDARYPRLPENSFDCVTIMGNSFGYFASKDDDGRVLDAVARLLRQPGILVLDLADGDWLRENFEPRSWEWIDQHQFVCRERSLAADGERLISREVIVHDERGVLADQFYAERLYSEATIADLLERHGFRNIRLHGQVLSASDREQDLGMMARRLFLTAQAPVKARTSLRPGDSPVSVLVLLGDPRLPDGVKRGGQFNEEDFETVGRLKDALAEIDGFTFTYLNNHATLDRDLAALKTDLVFNLCDEGFNNDPFMELHVPALLEMMELPYTGAAPGCLALCYDKGLVRSAAIQLDIPVPAESYVRRGDLSATLPAVFPALLKPNYGDSSQGITAGSVVYDNRALVACLEDLWERYPHRPVLVQEFLTGAEYSVALIGNPDHGIHSLPILEVDYSGLDADLPPILGYESKWLPDSPYWTQIQYREADLPDLQYAQLIDHSIRMFERLGCRDYARFDFRCGTDGVARLLEVNPNPGWCWDGKMNLMAGFQGLRYEQMLGAILNAARERLAASASRQLAVPQLAYG